MTARTPRRHSTAWPGGRRSPRHLAIAVSVVLVVVAAGLVVVSPLALDVFGNGSEWTRRSEVGQTYGAAAALLSVLALVGIAVSLVLQAREAKAAREQSSRGTHTELLQMALEDPVYRECWGPVDPARSDTEFRQHIYTNLIVSYWQSRYELGMFTETHVRAAAADMFAAAPGRRFWAATRQVRLETAQTRRARRFHRMLDEEYDRAVAARPALPEPSPPMPAMRRRTGRALGLIGAGAGAAAALRYLYRALTDR